MMHRLDLTKPGLVAIRGRELFQQLLGPLLFLARDSQTAGNAMCNLPRHVFTYAGRKLAATQQKCVDELELLRREPGRFRRGRRCDRRRLPSGMCSLRFEQRYRPLMHDDRVGHKVAEALALRT
jgi:hypothetical protein